MSVLATMVTMRTYGSWLRGSKRGWGEDGVRKERNEMVERWDGERMKDECFEFEDGMLREIGEWIGGYAVKDLEMRVYGLAVGRRHVHVLLDSKDEALGAVVRGMKGVVRGRLRSGRSIWSKGYDKQYCYDEAGLRARVVYVERHDDEVGCVGKGWGFFGGV